MSPHDIHVIMHHCVSREPWPLGNTLAYVSTLAWAKNHDLLRTVPGEPPIATERGRALLQMLCDTPLPVPASTFINPLTGKQVVAE